MAESEQPDSSDHGHPLVPALWAQANHDLRQPLQALFLMTRSLSRGLADPSQQKTLKYMDVALLGLQAKLDLLTELSRLENGTRAPVLRSCSLAGICKSVLADLDAISVDQGIRLRTRLNAASVISDPTLLGMIIKSLLLNAIKLSTRSDILVGNRLRKDRIRLEFYFKSSVLSDAYRRSAFVQITKMKEPCTSELGLGLGFIAHLVAKMDHRVDCSVLPYGGVCLALSLPPALDLPPRAH